MFCLQGASDEMINPSLACVLPSRLSLFLSPPPSRPLFCCLCLLSCCSYSTGSVCRVGILCQVVPLVQGTKHLFLSSLVSFPSRAALRFSSLPSLSPSFPHSLPPATFCSVLLLLARAYMNMARLEPALQKRFVLETLVLPIFFWSSLFSYHLPFYRLRLCLYFIVSQFQAFC